MYSGRQEKLGEILKLLASKREEYQQEIAVSIKMSERSIIRLLQILRRAGLIEIARKEPSSKHGMPKQIWSLTFAGIMSILTLSEIRPKEIDHIARIHADKWIIFQEWKDLTQEPEVKKMLVGGILSIQSPAILKPEEAGMYGEYIKDLGEAGAALQQTSVSHLYRDATLSALMLQHIFKDGAVPPWIYKPENQGDKLVRLWKTVYENPNIRSFIIREFAFENKRHQEVQKFQDWLTKKL
jgi:hypothetical protein